MSKKKKTKREIRTGIVEKHGRGYGFVKQEDDGDIFIAKSNMGGAMNGDLVEVDLLPSYLWTKSKEGIITGILERKYTEIVGTFHKNKRFGFVTPDETKNPDDVFIKKEFFRGAQNGDKVVAKLLHYPDKIHSAEGKITEIIARAGQVGGDISSLIRQYGLRESFPSRVNSEAKAAAAQEITPEILDQRLDLRKETIFTVDGPDAKDLDDAVSIKKLENGHYLLGVHIADVSHYVKEDGFMDREAFQRGTSVYLINRVMPMLPKALSNGVCSLNPDQDRLTISCFMEIDGEGNRINHHIEKSVIHSKGRMVYEDVSDIMEKDGKDLQERYPLLHADIRLMGELAEILRRKRKKQGSLDFEMGAALIKVDEMERPVEIGLEERRSGNRMIEEFMLAANETIAEHFFWLEAPFIYRVHEKPDGEKLTELKKYLSNFSIFLKGSPDHIHAKTLGDILDSLEGKPYEQIVNRTILRTMKKAYYSTSCDGHFGLAFPYYCHFTSPIRRYPDLMIHRIIKSYLDGDISDARLLRYRQMAEEAADVASQTEKRAQELERDVEKLKKAQYMVDRIGLEYDGIVSGVTDFGVYVELENTVEGMAFQRDLRRPYVMGEKVRIRVLDARPEERQIDFKILEEE